MKKKFCRKVLPLVFLILPFVKWHAQYKPLNIGDEIPSKVWSEPHQIINAKNKSKTLLEDKDKLILLDFWATWCGSCLKNFQKMDELQKKFGNNIKIIPVTKEDTTILLKFFTSKNGQRFAQHETIAGDKIFYELFTPRALPYIVWIKDGKVVNTTDAFQVNEKTISDILNNKESTLQSVIQIDRSRPLMLSQNYDLEKASRLMHYAFLAKGRIRAIPSGSGFHRSENIVYGRQFTNFKLLDIYRGIASEIFDQRNEVFTDKRLINLVKRKDDIDFPIEIESEENDKKLYSFEFIVPHSEADSLYQKMFTSLSHFSGYSSKWEYQNMKCLVLKKVGNTEKLKSKGGVAADDFFKKPRTLKNVPIKHLITALNANNEITILPVLDESMISGNIDLELGNVADVHSLRKSLRGYGLDLIEENRKILMLIIKDRDK